MAVPRTIRSARFYRRIELKLHRKIFRRRAVRLSLLLSNVVILALILTFVLQNPRTGVAVAKPLAFDSDNNTAIANPLDQLSSANIALTVARLSSLPETTAITNQAETQAADLAIIANSDDVLAKPQVVETALKSRADIEDYTTKAGDTIASLAAQFGITSNSIIWSNGLSGGDNTLPSGTKLVIPPITGIVYTVKTGDTPASLAAKFSANQAQIIAFNDAEISGLQVGEQILIPNGTEAAAVSSAYASPSGFPWGSGPIYGSNGYDFGFCTWYVATQVSSVPSNWGNASSWAYYARLSGWTVSSTPVAGSIAQTADAAGGQGHVAVVEAVSPNGDSILIKDMNNYGDGGGWDKVGTAWVPASSFQNFISH